MADFVVEPGGDDNGEENGIGSAAAQAYGGEGCSAATGLDEYIVGEVGEVGELPSVLRSGVECEELPQRNSHKKVESLWVKIRVQTNIGHLVGMIYYMQPDKGKLL